LGSGFFGLKGKVLTYGGTASNSIWDKLATSKSSLISASLLLLKLTPCCTMLQDATLLNNYCVCRPT